MKLWVISKMSLRTGLTGLMTGKAADNVESTRGFIRKCREKGFEVMPTKLIIC